MSDNATPDSLPGLDASSLTAIYQEQFRHIRHLDMEGYIPFALTLAVTLLVVVLDEAGIMSWERDLLHALFPHLLLLALAVGAGHHLVELASGTWRRFAVLTQVESALGLYQAGVMPPAFRFFAPSDFGSFVWRFIASRRGPLFIIYLIISGYVAVEIVEAALGGAIYPYRHLAVLFPLVPALLTLGVNYLGLRRTLLSLRRQAEASVAAPTDMADRFVAVGESLMLFTPPRVEDALRQFQRALVSNPDHPAAKQWVDKLLGGRTQP